MSEIKASLPRLSPGLVLDRYELIEPVGRGAMGEVWRARHTVTDAECAIKILHPHFADQEKKAQLFVQEAQVGARLNQHPNIVRVQDAARDPVTGLVFLVTELLEGQTLEERRLREGPLPPPLAQLVFAQLGSAVQTAHDAGIVHRDLKPGNLFLSRDHEGAPLLKVLDFGIARVLEGGGTRTATHIGTPAYAAPEQLGPAFRAIAAELGVSIAEDVSIASDVWSLGLTAYDLLTGAEPGSFWGVEADAELPLKIALHAAPRPTMRAGAAGALLPGGFDEWFARCADRDATLRWPSFREAALALVGLLERGVEAPLVEPSVSAEVAADTPDLEGPALPNVSEGPIATPNVSEGPIATPKVSDQPLALPLARPSERPPGATTPEAEIPAHDLRDPTCDQGVQSEPTSAEAPVGASAAAAHEAPPEGLEGEGSSASSSERSRRVRRAVWSGMVVFLGSMLLAVLLTQLWLSTGARLAVVVAGPHGAAIDPVEITVATESGKVERVCQHAPCILAKLKIGNYVVKVKAEGYQPTDPRLVRIARGPNQVDVELAPVKVQASLRVGVQGTGAFLLTIDRSEPATLPATVSELLPGDHVLRITDQKGLYEPFEKRVTLVAGEHASLEAKPKVARGRVTVTAGQEAEDARVVLVSGGERRLLPSLPMAVELTPDRAYQLTATKAGFEDFETTVSFDDGVAEKNVEVSMVKKESGELSAAPTRPNQRTPGGRRLAAAPAVTGIININSLPPSSVTVDGQPIGETPKRWTGPAGMHTIQFLHPRYETKTRTVEIKPGESALAVERFP